MKSLKRSIFMLAMIMAGALGLMAQNSLPAPGSGGSFTPNMGGGGGFGPGFGPGPGWNNGFPPGYVSPGYWGSPWYDGRNYNPTIVVAPTVSAPTLTNQGTEKVIACGYDAQGIWRVLPLYVSYVYNGVQYDVNVLNAWNPWTNTWDNGVDIQAYNCSHYLRNVLYKFYANLSTGTYYFNL